MSESTDQTSESKNEPEQSVESEAKDQQNLLHSKQVTDEVQETSSHLNTQENIEEKNQIIEPEQSPDSPPSDDKGEEGEVHDQQQDILVSQEPTLEQSKSMTESQDSRLNLENLTTRAIEDEEMPSMVARPSPTKVNESQVSEKQEEVHNSTPVKYSSQPPQPSQADESEDSDVVCIDDDDDEEEEEEEGSSARSSMSYDESSYDEYEEEEANHRYKQDQIRRIRQNERMMEEEEIDEETDEEMMEEEDYEDEFGEENDEMHTDSEPDAYDGRSDDYVVRFSNGLQRTKERSASLQDVNLISPRKINPFRQKVTEKISAAVDRHTPGKRYSHVGSKVKKYIDDMTEQRRMSTERRKKIQDEDRLKNQQYRDAALQKSDGASSNKNEFSNKTLATLAECDEVNARSYMSQAIENGNISILPVDNKPQRNEKGFEGKSMFIDDHADNRTGVMNGAATQSQTVYPHTEEGIIGLEEEYSPKPLFNGEDPLNTDCDMRTLSYDEYMKGDNISKQINQDIIQSSIQLAEVDEPQDKYDIRIECVTSSEIVVDEGPNKLVPVLMVNRETSTDYQVDSEVAKLKDLLSKHETAYDHLRESYQSLATESAEIRQDNLKLREHLAICQKQLKQQLRKPETKERAVQISEPVTAQPVTAKAPSMPVIDLDDECQPKKVNQSVASGVSSAWSESSNSAVTSIDLPPNVTNAIHSDISTQERNKELKRKDDYSKGFLTSSKILQTLSNISSHVSSKIKGKQKTPDSSSYEEPDFAEPAAPSSRKRKAVDTMEMSASSQPMKIPHTAKSNFEKGVHNIGTDPKIMDLNIEKNPDFGIREDGEFELPEMEDEVKVFIYPETDSNQSFLIQAKEIGYKPKGGIRECGPYLLGNVEVYMTEMNGTINIWGKEVTPQPEDIESSRSREERPSELRWQSTPRVGDNCESGSVGKRPRVMSRLNHKNYGQRPVMYPPCNQNVHDHNNHHGYYASVPAIRVEDTHCGYSHSVAPPCCKPTFLDSRRHSMPNVCHDSHCSPMHCSPCQSHFQPQQQHSHQQNFIKHHLFQDSENEDEELIDEENVQKLIHSKKDNFPSHFSSSKAGPSSARNNAAEMSAYEADDFVHLQKPSQDVEDRKTKNSRKVKGLLMDLIKGCGDCRTPSPSKKNLGRNSSVYGPASSSERKTTPTNERASENRVNKPADMKNKLEIFQQEMEKLQAQSKALMEEMMNKVYEEEGSN